MENVFVFHGGMTAGELGVAMRCFRAVPPDAQRVLLSTGAFIGEGFDDDRLDTLFLALPVSWRGRIAQYVGRLHRRHEGKREVRVFDYVDSDVKVCVAMFARRAAGYEALGYRVEETSVAPSGWPDDVALPGSLDWREKFSRSLRRLCDDGVDSELADLFLSAAEDPSGTAGELGKARSLSEEFLFRRLETLDATRGKFVLNARLPVAFGSSRYMEIDLFCAERRLAIELDGMQHLGDVDAYRRDRSKDLLLQQTGCTVMRFLGLDVVRRLDVVLERILKEMSRT